MSESFDARPTLLLISSDLFLGSRIAGLAERCGYRTVTSAGGERARDIAAEGRFDRVLVDLTTPGVAIASLTEAIGAEAASRVAAYAPHVRVDLLKAARAAGLVAVFTRSQLESELPVWLA